MPGDPDLRGPTWTLCEDAAQYRTRFSDVPTFFTKLLSDRARRHGDYLNTLAIRNKDAGKEHLEYG